ncbi:hypothetical protein MGL_1344 [Malassezia globosa CBS 7966]|uniref:Cytochrome b5 heme-binding domain-containing protein n=1 Tax=Malassezia globosa (strain ATCC MYA-4612 / CBS 7966) TaxID=425265 RepID=A8PX68_MALGO|nr:uncharacterized protein MGL_1344 [Malassezia globosa CBS 7966]EDP43947.1 hypothetical protein MGL_1344 [Malassezia globosa CBS 7966]
MVSGMTPSTTPTQPPREDPFTPEELSKYDGTVDSKPVYVAVKAPGKGYSIFAGKDASRALGMSSLKPEHAVSDYTTLTPQQMKVLDDWFEYYKKVQSWKCGE